MKRCLFLMVTFCVVGLIRVQAETAVRILCMGDSITEGGSSFANWRYPLVKKLTGAGYRVVYVGSKHTASPFGELAHEGYGGKTVEYLATVAAARFATYTPDVLLLHAGHNHTQEEKPIGAIIQATEKIIADFRQVNPQATVFLAQVIPSLKLPKYAYLPALNRELVKLGSRLDTPVARVIVVDCATGFDPHVDCVADRVHPSELGAEKMATAWFTALDTWLSSRKGSLRAVTD